MMEIVVWIQRHSVLMMLAIFVVILATTFWPGRRSGFDKIARIPLDDDR